MGDVDRPHVERALLAQLRQGDGHAFATIMHEYFEPLARFAFYIVGSRDVAEDIVQHVFVRLWERRETLAPESLKPYLFQAVRNRALDDQSASDVRERHTSSSTSSLSTSTPSHEEEILTRAAIQAAVDRLPTNRRLALRLRMEEGMTNAEIGKILGVSTLAAQLLVSRAGAEIKKLLRSE